MDFKKTVQVFVGGIIIIAVAMTLIGFNGEQIDITIQWIIPIGISFILSSFIGTVIEGFGGGVLKTITLTIPIGKFGISISVFAILIFTIKHLWF